MVETMKAAMSVAITEAERAAGRAGRTLEARVRASMRATKAHWLLTDEDARFRAAIGGVLISYKEGSPEYLALKFEFNGLKMLSAMVAASEAGLSVMPPDLSSEVPPGFVPLKLLDIWREVEGI